MKLSLLICAVILLSISFATRGLSQGTDASIQRVKVYRSSKDANPDKRVLTEIGQLDRSGIHALASFVKLAKRKTFSYVLSRYYLDAIDETGKVQQRYGVVIGSDGTLDGVDITGGDPAKTHVTSPHSLLVTRDKELRSALLRAIEELEKGQVK